MLYPNPPIQEALFDIRVEKLDAISSPEELERFKVFVDRKYTKSRKKINFVGGFQINEENTSTDHDATQTGIAFFSEDEKRLIQVSMNGITLNIINSYEKWDTHFGEFIKLWKAYKNEFKPTKVERIATRFLNTIKLKLPLSSFQDYIVYSPPIPNSNYLSNLITNFFMQVNVPCKDGLRHAIITETILPIETANILPFLLDIDVFQTEELEMDTKNLIANFENIHHIKNQVFENCITDKTRELFK